MKVVINTCFGGFGLSAEAYEKLAEWGIPIRQYDKKSDGSNEECIYDHELTPEGTDSYSDMYWKYKEVSDRYWEVWTSNQRDHPLIVRVVEELGSERASGRHARLKVVEVPDGVEYLIEEYDGREHVAERHHTWS